MVEPNLIVTGDPEHVGRTEAAVKSVLASAEVDFEFLPSDLSGLHQLRVNSDARELVRALRARCREDPAAFIGTFRWVPVETMVEATPQGIEEVARAINGRISDAESWAIRVKTHGSPLHSREVTELAAKHIDHPKVDLDDPERQVRLEVIGDRLAASLLEASEFLNVNDFRTRSEPRE